MKKLITIILTVSLLMTVAFAFTSTVNAGWEDYNKYNLLDKQSATLEGGIGKWEKGLEDGEPKPAPGKGVTGDAMLSGPRTKSWAGAYLNIAPVILDNGVGQYSFTMQIKAEKEEIAAFRMLIRDSGGGYHYDCAPQAPLATEEWTEFEILVDVIKVDKAKGEFTMEVVATADPVKTEELGTEITVTDGKLYLTFDTGEGPVLIDNVCAVNLNTVPTPEPTPTPTPTPVPTPTLVPTATKAAVATTAPAGTTEAPTDKKDGGNLTTIIIIAASVLLVGGAAAFLFLKPKKKDEDIDIDTNNDQQ